MIKKYGFLLVLPFIAALVTLAVKFSLGPYWLGRTSDPAYFHLVQSLYLFKGVAPFHIVHPAAPLMALIVLVVKLFNPWAPVPELLAQALSNPEFYLNSVYWVLFTASFLSFILVGVYAFRRTASRTFALFFQVPAFLYLALPGHGWFILASVTAEMGLVPAINLFFMCLIKIYANHKAAASLRSALLFALACAFGLALKITFLAALIVPLFLLKGRKVQCFFVGSVAVLFGLFLFPVWGRMELIVWTVVGLVTSSGPLGSGTHNGFIAWDGMWNNAGVLFRDQWAVCAVFVVGALWSGWRLARRSGSREERIILVLCLAAGVHFLMIIKHGTYRYFQLDLALAGAVMAFLTRSLAAAGWWRVRWSAILLVVVVLLSGVQGVGQAYDLNGWRKKKLEFLERIRARYPQDVILGYYPSSGQGNALFVANDIRNGRVLGDELNRLYPGRFFFASWNYRVSDFKDVVYLSDIQKLSAGVYFQGDCAFRFEQGPYRVTRVEEDDGECLFRLDSSLEPRALAEWSRAKTAWNRDDFSGACLAAKKSLASRFYPPALPRQMIRRACGQK
ncbi:MAG: hypothetical protein HQL20_00145 [Candidatus Omnitrophica bacterium]|nr:hypothetical protein [Candidatus Omnitrophota bacterium]